MVKMFTILRNLCSSLIGYLRPNQPKIQPGDERTKEPINECKQFKKQRQRTKTFLAIFLFMVCTEYKQINKQLNDITTENESLKQAGREIQQLSKTFECERDEAWEVSMKLRLENTLLEQKIEQLESHKKVLIQELGGSLDGQDIEFRTWEFLIQAKRSLEGELKEERNKVATLEQKINILEHMKNQLETELKQEKAKVVAFEQRIKTLEQVKNQLELDLNQEKSKVTTSERATNDFKQGKNERVATIENLKHENNQMTAKIKQLEQIIKHLEQKIKQLEYKLDSSSLEQDAERRSCQQYQQQNLSDERNLL